MSFFVWRQNKYRYSAAAEDKPAWRGKTTRSQNTCSAPSEHGHSAKQNNSIDPQLLHVAGGTQVSCACPDTGTHTLWCTNDRISVFFLVCGSSRQLEKCAPTVTVHRSGHRRLVTSTTATPSRHGAWFHDVESGRLPAYLDMHSICVGMPHWRARTYACCPCGRPYYCQSPAAGCKFAERATTIFRGWRLCDVLGESNQHDTLPDWRFDNTCHSHQLRRVRRVHGAPIWFGHCSPAA